jgi:hypothetical protein
VNQWEENQLRKKKRKRDDLESLERRETCEKMKNKKDKETEGPLIEEMTPPLLSSSCQPQYRIRQEPTQAEFPEYLLAEFYMKDLVCWRVYLFLQICKAC